LARNDEPSLSAEEVALAVRGDRAAVTRIVRAWLPRVYGLCLRLSGKGDLAEEATQETFLRALRALSGLEKPESFGSWILTIAANTAKEIHRRRSPLPLAGSEPTAPAAEANGARDLQRSALDHAFSILDPGERRLFLLHAVEGVSLEDLAQNQQTSLPAMKSRMHRIREKVRRQAKAYFDRNEGDS